VWISFLALSIPVLIGLGYNAPSFAAVQGLVSPTMRAMASAVFLFILNLIGLGLGPPLMGALSDILASSVGDQSLRYALLVGCLFNIWAAFHYYIASKTISAELNETKRKMLEEAAANK